MKNLSKGIVLFIILFMCAGMISVSYARTPKKLTINQVETAYTYIGSGVGQTDITPEGDFNQVVDELNLSEIGEEESEGEDLKAKPALISPYDPVSDVDEEENPSLISTKDVNEVTIDTESVDEDKAQSYTDENVVSNSDDLVVGENETSDLNRTIGIVLTIVKLATNYIGIALIVIAIITAIKKSKLLKMIDKEVSEDFTEEDKKEAKENARIYGNRIIVFIVIAAILLGISGVITIVTQFAAKPVIYIYPEEDDTKVSITVSNPEKLTCTYPKYNDGWTVVADRDGTLTDETGREYYSLYWEGKDYKNSNFEDGFVVKGEDTAKFLEEKLEILGLNEREAEEFIIYWLPELEGNNYNLIRFKTAEEIESEMGLNIEPKPDTVIRVMMEYKPLMFKKDVKEQVLEKQERVGYTVVEWGGVKTK